MMGRKALITGITGQDGSYLAELLLAQGAKVQDNSPEPPLHAAARRGHTAIAEPRRASPN